MTRNSKQCLNNNMLYYPPRLSIQLFYSCCSHQFDMSYPYCYSGPKCQLEPFFDYLTMKCTKQNGARHVQFMLSERVLARWRHLVAFKKARNLLCRTMYTVLYCRNTTAIKMVSKVDTFCIIVLFAPWWPSGRYWARSCPMAAFSGFYESPGHAASGDVCGIAP